MPLDNYMTNNENNLNEAPETILAYIAGFVDGEGSISVAKSQTKIGGVDGYRYRVAVKITNTDPKPLRLIEKYFDITGKLFLRLESRMMKNGRKCKDRYNVLLNDRKAFVFLKAIRPYLVIKRKQADLCIEMQKMIDVNYEKRKHDLGINRGSKTYLGTKHWEKRRWYYEKARELNLKGVSINV